MCGIAGVRGWVDENVLDSMLDCLVHRGPDDRGKFADPDAGVMLGNQRLSIVDVEGGHQPLSNEEGDVTVVFNGEIYNHEDLRTDLEARGHRFNTRCDTEVLVHLWEEHGRDMPRYLDGMFAFSIWDSEDEKLFAARDPLGIKPLYWARVDNGVAWASEIQPLLAAGAETKIDERAVFNYFYARYTPWPQTPLKAVRKLPPATSMTVTGDGVEHSRYWRPSPNNTDASFSRISDRVRKLLELSVERRLMSDVPIGAFLSGGLDSTAVVGIMTRYVDDLRTYSVRFEDPSIDESDEARYVADHFGTDHQELTVDLNSFNRFEEVVTRLGEPVADPAILPTALLAEAASEDVKVVQTGEGADELFGGYYRYRQAPRHRKLASHVPASLLRAVGSFSERVPIRSDYLRYATAMASDVDAVVGTASRMDVPPSNYLATNQTPMTSGFRESVEESFKYADETFESRLEAFDLTHWLPDDLLYKVDQATMQSSLEARVPYLSTDLIEAVYGLPPELKLQGGYKPLLREAVAELVPDRTLRRDKQGFELPLDAWFRRDHLFVNKYLEVDILEKTPVVDRDAVLDLLDTHRRGTRDCGDSLWKILSYVAWYDTIVRD